MLRNGYMRRLEFALVTKTVYLALHFPVCEKHHPHCLYKIRMIILSSFPSTEVSSDSDWRRRSAHLRSLSSWWTQGAGENKRAARATGERWQTPWEQEKHEPARADMSLARSAQLTPLEPFMHVSVHVSSSPSRRARTVWCTHDASHRRVSLQHNRYEADRVL